VTALIETVEQAKGNPEFLNALTALLFQMADDDFILAYRGSEWLGLAPHIEEDVAFSSMSQDTMGHAVLFYELLEDLGVGRADDLAQLRDPQDFRNALLVERPNGTGHYVENPRYDWAYAVVRWYFYGLFKQARLEALSNSSFKPLVLVSQKMMKEQRYHVMHWQVWIAQLANSNEEARTRITNAVDRVWEDLGSLFAYGSHGAEFVKQGLIESEDALKQRFEEKAKKAFAMCNFDWKGLPQAPAQTGRDGQHTQDLIDAVNTLSEVYRLDPSAAW